MAEGNVENLGGIGVQIIVNATEAKQALAGIPRSVKVRITVERDASFQNIKRDLGTIPVVMKVTANVASVRALRQSIQSQIAGAGGVRVPITVLFSQAQGARMRQQIRQNIGSPNIEMTLGWKWGPGGPPPAGFTPGPGGPGEGGGIQAVASTGGGGGPATTAAGPVVAAVAGGGVAGDAAAAKVRLTSEQRRAAQQIEREKLLDRLANTTSVAVIARTRKRLSALDKALGYTSSYAARPTDVGPGEREGTPFVQGRYVKGEVAQRMHGGGPVRIRQEGELAEGELMPGERGRRRGERADIGFTGARGATRPGAMPQIMTADLLVSEAVKREVSRIGVSQGKTPGLMAQLSRAGTMGLGGPVIRQVTQQAAAGQPHEAAAIGQQALDSMMAQARTGQIPGISRGVGRRLLSTKGNDVLENLVGSATQLRKPPDYQKGVSAGIREGRYYDIAGKRSTAEKLNLPGTPVKDVLTGQNLSGAIFGIQVRMLKSIVTELRKPELVRTTATTTRHRVDDAQLDRPFAGRPVEPLTHVVPATQQRSPLTGRHALVDPGLILAGGVTREGGLEERPRGTPGPVRPERPEWRLGTRPMRAPTTTPTAIRSGELGEESATLPGVRGAGYAATVAARKAAGAPTEITYQRRLSRREIAGQTRRESEAGASERQGPGRSMTDPAMVALRERAAFMGRNQAIIRESEAAAPKSLAIAALHENLLAIAGVGTPPALAGPAAPAAAPAAAVAARRPLAVPPITRPVPTLSQSRIAAIGTRGLAPDVSAGIRPEERERTAPRASQVLENPSRLRVFRGSSRPTTPTDTPYIRRLAGRRGASYGEGAYVTPNEQFAQFFARGMGANEEPGGPVASGFVDPSKLLDVRHGTRLPRPIRSEIEKLAGKRFTPTRLPSSNDLIRAVHKVAENRGFQGIRAGPKTDEETVIFNPENITPELEDINAPRVPGQPTRPAPTLSQSRIAAIGTRGLAPAVPPAAGAWPEGPERRGVGFRIGPVGAEERARIVAAAGSRQWAAARSLQGFGGPTEAPAVVAPPPVQERAPLKLSSRGTFAGEAELEKPRVSQIAPKRLVPFRELDREKTPKLRSEPGYLNELTKQIDVEGIREPLELEHDALTHSLLLREGNHRLAAALRLGLPTVPVVAFESARGPGLGEPSTRSAEEMLVAQRQAPNLKADRERLVAAAGLQRAAIRVPEAAPVTEIPAPEPIAQVVPRKRMGKKAREAAAQAERIAAISASGQAPNLPVGTGIEPVKLFAEPQVAAAGAPAAPEAPTPITQAASATEHGFYQDARGRWRGPKGFVSAETMAAQGVVQAVPPTGAGGAGGGGGGETPARAGGGGGGGRYHVWVDNMPKGGPPPAPGRAERTTAAQPVAGTPNIMQLQEGAGGGAGPVVGKIPPGTLPAAEEKIRLAGSLNQQILEGLRTKTLTPEQAQQIQGRGASRTAQEVIGEQTGEPVSGGTAPEALAALRTRLSEARQGLPIRSPAVTIAQKFAGPQRGAVTARLAEAGRLGTQAEAIERENVKLVDVYDAQTGKLKTINDLEAEGKTLTSDQLRLKKSLPGEIEKTTGALKSNVAAQSQLLTQANKMAGLTAGEQAANLARSFTGNIVGTLGYGAALGAVAGSLALVAKAAGPVIERTLGYQNVTAGLNNQLAEQQRQQGGNVQSLVANQLAATNMTKTDADLIKDQLAIKTTTQAGSRAIQDQTEQIAAGVNAQQALAGNAGDRGGGATRYSANQDLYTSSGGLLNTSLFAPQQSAQEAIARKLDLVGQGLNPDKTRLASNQSGFSIIGDFLSGKQTPQIPENRTAFKSFQNDVAAAGVTAKGAGQALGAVRGNAQQVDRTFKALQAADLQEMAKAAKDAGIAFTGLTGNVAADAVAVTNLTQKLSEAASKKNVDQLLEGAATQMKATVFGIQQDLHNALSVSLPAQRALQNFAQPPTPFGQGIVPLQRNAPGTGGGAFGPGAPGAATQINVPGVAPTSIPTGLSIGGKQQFGGVPAEATASFDRYRAAGTAALDAIAAKAREGEAQLRKLGVPESIISQMGSLRDRIQDIGVQQSNLQLDLQYTQYNHQLYLANRQLGDLAGLAGKAGATQIGILQRQDLLLGRRTQQLSLQTQQLGLQSQKLSQQSAIIGQQSNLLQLQQSQRQINFQVAVAGFTAPGATPEERHARVEEAKAEAAIAQKQLDYQKQQYALQQQQVVINAKNLSIASALLPIAEAQYKNQVALQDALNSRAYADQLAAIAELKKNFTVNLEIQNLDQIKALLTTQKDAIVQEAQQYEGAGESLMKALAAETTSLLSVTGDFTVSLVQKVNKAFTDIATNFKNSELGTFLGGGSGSAPGGAPGGSIQTKPDHGIKPTALQTGAAGRTTGAMTMTIGEAGPEQYAILRNPREVQVPIGMSGASGGSPTFININIAVTGNNIRDEGDIEKLTDTLVVKLEEKLGRRGAMFGFSVAR